MTVESNENSLPAIPMVDLTGEVDELWPELSAAFERVVRSTRFIMGPEVQSFESEFAEFLGIEYAVGVNSGSDALTIGLRAMGVGPGDEVLTTPFTFVATGTSILHVGAKPVFCDIDPETLNLSPEAVRAAVTEKTRAVIPVHLFGHPVDMDAIGKIADEHDLRVLEDVAQALTGEHQGRQLGTIGDAATFSFFPSKNLGAYGDGGMLVTSDAKIAEAARMLRSHGSKRRYHNEILGYNSRLDAMQASILRVKLRHLAGWTKLRISAAATYGRLLADVSWVTCPVTREDSTHSFHQYTIRVPAERREALQARLSESGISSMIYYPVLLPDMPIFEAYAGNYPAARKACAEVMSLPIWPGITESIQERIVSALVGEG